MGWWSEEILGGDMPMDTIIELQEMANIKVDDDKFGFTKRSLRKHLEQFIDYARCTRMSEREVTYQVVGELCIRTGLPLTTGEKELFSKYAKDSDIKNWGDINDRRARKQCIDTWATSIENLPLVTYHIIRDGVYEGDKWGVYHSKKEVTQAIKHYVDNVPGLKWKAKKVITK